MKKINILYVTKSEFKREEIELVKSISSFRNEEGVDQLIGDRFTFEFSGANTDEPLEVDLEKMVRHKAVSAYKRVLRPCIVEHAGLILRQHYSSGYPGGLTQPMMDALSDYNDFLRRLSAAGEPAVAKAVFGYCDGMRVRTFVGETEGCIASLSKGDRKFYWDTVFEPDGYDGLTYAEITEKQGLSEKMKISQSFKALREFLQFRIRDGSSSLFSEFE